MKWNHEARMRVYSTLVDYFGPYREWAGKTRPGDKNIRYAEVMEIIADGLAKDGRYGSRPKPSAVENQVALILKPGGMLRYMAHVIRNMSAALESNFVAPLDLKNMGFRLTQNKSDMGDKYTGTKKVETETAKKQITEKYGLRHKKTNKIVGYHIENSNEYYLSHEWDGLWLVNTPEHAEYVRNHSAEWYNARKDTPNHKYDAEELGVVKVLISTETVDPVKLPTSKEYIYHMYGREDSKFYNLSHYQRLCKKIDGGENIKYTLYNLREYLRDLKQ